MTLWSNQLKWGCKAKARAHCTAARPSYFVQQIGAWGAFHVSLPEKENLQTFHFRGFSIPENKTLKITFHNEGNKITQWRSDFSLEGFSLLTPRKENLQTFATFHRKEKKKMENRFSLFTSENKTFKLVHFSQCRKPKVEIRF